MAFSLYPSGVVVFLMNDIVLSSITSDHHTQDVMDTCEMQHNTHAHDLAIVLTPNESQQTLQNDKLTLKILINIHIHMLRNRHERRMSK